MGQRRGKRNAASEKVWPGQNAAEVRAIKRSLVALAGDDLPEDELPECEGNDLPVLLPVTGDVLHVRHREQTNAERCEVIMAPPELTLANAQPPMHQGMHIPPSKRRRAVNKVHQRIVIPKKQPPPGWKVWIGQEAPPTKQARGQMRDVRQKKNVLAFIREMGCGSKLDAFIKICRMGTRIEYALPELFYIGDPCRAMLFVESIDLGKFALAVGARR